MKITNIEVTYTLENDQTVKADIDCYGSWQQYGNDDKYKVMCTSMTEDIAGLLSDSY